MTLAQGYLGGFRGKDSKAMNCQPANGPANERTVGRATPVAGVNSIRGTTPQGLGRPPPIDSGYPQIRRDHPPAEPA